MRKLIALLTALVLGVGGVSFALAAKTHKVKVGGSIHSAIVGASKKGADIAGKVTDKHYGTGAILFKDAAPAKRVHTPFTFFTSTGSYHGVAISDITADKAGNVTISNGTFKVTGGTGPFRGATGNGTFSGTGKLSSSQSLTYKGTLTLKG